MKPDPWMDDVAAKAGQLLRRHGVQLTLGGEPTFVPHKPSGAEWNYSAVGPEKLDYAWKMARTMVEDFLPDGVPFFCPGKQYPGEPNPRWALRILYSKDRRNPDPANRRPVADLAALRRILAKGLGVRLPWERFQDPHDPKKQVWAVLLDHDEKEWVATPWNLKPSQCRLSAAEGPSGLRLPLHLLPPEVTRRSLTLEQDGTAWRIFFPPLLEKPFVELLELCENSKPVGAEGVQYQGYLPPKLSERWEVLGIASDPGVLEINLPPCYSWQEYATWLDRLDHAATRAGLVTWRIDRGEFPGGTGGGNHLLFGAPPGASNGFYENPEWLAGVLAYWQRHPSLSYLFTGDYVGASSQAPRPDESGIPVEELDFALRDLRRRDVPTPAPLLAETLKHLLVDVAGNTHRAEISLDKFYAPDHPAGLMGLVEFRAIETLPSPRWSAAVALLWLGILARLRHRPWREELVSFGPALHDRFFLPQILWLDLLEVLWDLRQVGLEFSSEVYHEIWDWKYPVLWSWEKGGARCMIRRAREAWPLLAEVPNEGGSTSRFVDSSLRRVEISANAAFTKQHRLLLNGKRLPLQRIEDGTYLAGVRYRHSNLYPALHPRQAIQLPLELQLFAAGQARHLGSWQLASGAAHFVEQKTPRLSPKDIPRGQKLHPLFPGALTGDLRW
jgi:uncharacterized protein (DUF2126 family)